MTGILDTFYFLFKSNSAETVKGNKEVEKSALAAGAATKKTNEESEKLGKSFTNAIEDATRALAAYVSYQGIKSGILDAEKLNRSLSIQTKLWGANANEVAGAGAAIKAAGGSAEELYAWYDKIYKQRAAIGLKTAPVGSLLDQIHNQVVGLPPEQAQFIFDKYGIDGVGTRALLSKSDEDYRKARSAGDALTSNTERGSQAAREFGEAWDRTSTSLTKLWTTIDTFILPALTGVANVLTYIFDYLAEHDDAALAFFAALSAAAVGVSVAFPSIIAGFSGMGAAALAAAAPIAALVAQLAAIVAVATVLPTASQEIGEWIGHQANKLRGKGDANGILPGKPGYNGGAAAGKSSSSLDFWMSQGYSRAQAAGLVANENRESGGNAGARGDGGSAVGLFQWHPDRVQNILRGTGIDVRTAGRDEQLRAAAWELQQLGLSGALKNINDPGKAAAFISRRYERPANGLQESLIRANSAMQIAGSTPFASQGSGRNNSTSVRIDNISVHTNATDANGIANDIGGSLKDQIRQVYAQNNDAVAY